MRKKQKPVRLKDNLSLRPLADGKWEMRIHKPDKRKVLYGTQEEATAEAYEIYNAAGTVTNSNPTVSEAIHNALADGNANEETLDRYTREANRFLEWFGKAYPGTHNWKQVRYSMVKAYQDKLERQGLARDSVRLAMFPLRKTSLFYHNEYPRIFDHITRKVDLPKKVKRTPRALTMAQVHLMLTWLKENRPTYYPIAALSVGMGMRLREPTGILNKDIDLATGMITLEHNHIRNLKNDNSIRTIPMTGMAREAIEHYMATAKVRTIHPNEPLFLNERGLPYNKGDFGDDTRTVKDALIRAVGFPEWFTMDSCRPTFNTLCVRAHALEPVLDAYQGRSHQTVGRAHYLEISMYDLDGITQVFDRLSGYASIDTTTKATLQPYIENS